MADHKLEKLIGKPIFFSGKSYEDKMSGVSRRISVHLLAERCPNDGDSSHRKNGVLEARLRNEVR